MIQYHDKETLMNVSKAAAQRWKTGHDHYASGLPPQSQDSAYMAGYKAREKKELGEQERHG
jgi:hypothetical protein